MKRKIPVKPLYILYVLFVFFSCSQYNEYRVQEWQNAFFLNDSTLGVIGWDYDLDESTNALVLSDYKNVKQIYYEYNLNTEELEKIFTLSSIEIIPVYYFYTSFLFPWLFYSTKEEEGSKEIGIFNVETKENRIFLSEEGYSGLYPLTISKNGRYFGYRLMSHPDFRFSIYDVKNNKDIKFFTVQRPLYIDDDSLKAILLSPSNTQNWFICYDLETEEMDTLAENIYGYIDFHVTSDITLFHKDGVWSYFLNEDLLKGKFEVHAIDNLSMAKKGSCHINFNTGNAVYSTISIFIVDYRNNKEAKAILKYSKEER